MGQIWHCLDWNNATVRRKVMGAMMKLLSCVRSRRSGFGLGFGWGCAEDGRRDRNRGYKKEAKI